MTGGRRFDPNELGTDQSDELEDALVAAASLGAAVDVPPVSPSPAFTDRVMAALVDEPAPSPVGFMVPLRRRGFLAGFSASVGQAWASLGGGGRPFLARASALAYVLAIVVAGTSLAGVATIGVAGALGMLGPTATQSAAPSPGPVTSPEQSPSPSIQSAPPTPIETVEPSETPEASDDHGGGGAEPSDDHGGNSGPGSSGDDDEHGSESDDSETETPDSSRTPRPTKTPEPSETPD